MNTTTIIPCRHTSQRERASYFYKSSVPSSKGSGYRDWAQGSHNLVEKDDRI